MRRNPSLGQLTPCAIILVACVAGCVPFGPVLPALTAALSDGVTFVVSLDRGDGIPVTGGRFPAISGDGQTVAFTLYNVDITGEEVFVRNLTNGELSRVSVNSDGVPADDGSELPLLSRDGRFVAFLSDADNLTDGNATAFSNVFVHDRQTGDTTLVSVNSDGTAGTLGAEAAVLSADARFVAFKSASTNLVPDDTNGVQDVFLHDRQTGDTTRVNVDSAGAPDDGTGGNFFGGRALAINEDGGHIAFVSPGVNLVTGDTNSVTDVFVHERVSGKTQRVSIASDGSQADGASSDPAISASGRRVAFISAANNLDGGAEGINNIFVHDRDADGNGTFDETCNGCRTTTRIAVDRTDPRGDGVIASIALSGDGTTLAYERAFSMELDAPEPNFDFNDTDVYVVDIAAGTTRRVTADLAGMRIEQTQVEFTTYNVGIVNDSSLPALSDDGTRVAYQGNLRFTFALPDDQVFVEVLTP